MKEIEGARRAKKRVCGRDVAAEVYTWVAVNYGEKNKKKGEGSGHDSQREEHMQSSWGRSKHGNLKKV